MSIQEDEFGSRSAAEEVPAGDEVERLMLLVEASGKLLGSPRIEDVLPAVLELAQRILAADAYAVWRHDDDGVWGPEIAAGLSAEYLRAAAAAVRESPSEVPLDEAIVVENVEHIRWPSPAHRAAYDEEGIQALLVVPLRVRGEASGTLVFYYRQPRRFDEAERRTAGALGNLAASASSPSSASPTGARSIWPATTARSSASPSPTWIRRRCASRTG